MTDFNPNMLNGAQFRGENTSTESITSFSIEDLIKNIFRNWYWFAISMFLCLCVGVLYVKTTPKIYKRDATILVKAPTSWHSRTSSEPAVAMSTMSSSCSSLAD